MADLPTRFSHYKIYDFLTDVVQHCACFARRIFRGDCRSYNGEYYHMTGKAFVKTNSPPAYYYEDRHSYFSGTMIFGDPLNILVFCFVCFAAGIFIASEYIHRVFPGAFRKPPPTLAERRHSVMRQQEAATALEPYEYQSRRRPSQLPSVEEPLVHNVANPAAANNAAARANSGGAPNENMETLQAKVRIKALEQNGADWVNKVLNWLYHRYNTTPEFGDRYLVSLNEYAKHNANQLTCLLTFERLFPSAQGVKVSQVSVEAGPEHIILIECNLECRHFGFEVTGTDTAPLNNHYLHQAPHSSTSTPSEPITYRANIPELRTRLRLIVIGTEPSTIRAGLFDTEKLDVECTPTGPASAMGTITNDGEQALQTMIVEQAIAQCMLHCTTEFKVQGSVYRGFPQSPAPVIVGSSAAAATSPSNWSDSGLSSSVVAGGTGGQNTPHYLSTPGGSNTSRSIESSPIFRRAGTNPMLIDETLRVLQNPKLANKNNYNETFIANGINTDELLVKVVGAKNLLADVQEPFCVVELDEPAQKYTTNVAKESPRNPYWNENFLFVLQQRVSCEILFEIHDKKKPKKSALPEGFIGTAIVSAAELLKQPSRKMECPLISRPYFDDEVSGTITVEFLTLRNGQPVTTTASKSPFYYSSDPQVFTTPPPEQPTQLLNEFNSGSVTIHGNTSGKVSALGACAGGGGVSPTTSAGKGENKLINKINPVKVIQRARSSSRGRQSNPNSRNSSPNSRRRGGDSTEASTNDGMAVDLHGHASSMAVGNNSGRESRQSDARSDITSTSVTVESISSGTHANDEDGQRKHARSVSRRDSLKETLGRLRRRISAGGRRAKSVDRVVAQQQQQQQAAAEAADVKYQYKRHPSSPTYLRMHEDKWQIPSDASSTSSPTGADGEFGVVLITKQRLKNRSKSVGPDEQDDEYRKNRQSSGRDTPTSTSSSVKDWVKNPRASLRIKKQHSNGGSGLGPTARMTGDAPVLNTSELQSNSFYDDSDVDSEFNKRSVAYGHGSAGTGQQSSYMGR